MSDHFVKDPLEAVKVGDVMEFRIISLDKERRRIGLSRKSDARTAGQGDKGSPNKAKTEHEQKLGNKEYGGKERVQGKSWEKPQKTSTTNTASRSKDDDGTMYNPFADAFKKMGKK
jgi:uncharacterized protein